MPQIGLIRTQLSGDIKNGAADHIGGWDRYSHCSGAAAGRRA
jgi:hypothetical protein